MGRAAVAAAADSPRHRHIVTDSKRRFILPGQPLLYLPPRALIPLRQSDEGSHQLTTQFRFRRIGLRGFLLDFLLGFLLGFLLDGFPVYGPQENGAAVAESSLDAYHGHKHATADYPAGIYHYHVTNTDPYINGAGFFGTPGTISQ